MSAPLVTTSVSLARANGWQPGTHLTDGRIVIEITGHGYEKVLARRVSDDDYEAPGCEHVWSLLENDWRLESQS